MIAPTSEFIVNYFFSSILALIISVFISKVISEPTNYYISKTIELILVSSRNISFSS